MNLNSVEYWYIRNAQGDIIGLHDKDGVQVVSYVYDSWGKLVSITGTMKDSVGVKNPYRYRGYRYDTETGLYYLQSRYYNAEWGRFINADGLVGVTGELLSHNMFMYCNNNPVNMHDPSGYLAWFIPMAIFAIDIIAIVSVFVMTQAPAISQAVTAITPHVDKIAAVQDKVGTSKDGGKKTPKKNNKKTNKNTNKDNLNPQQLNQYKSKVLEGKDVNFKSKEQAVDFVKKKFPDFKQEVAQSRSSQGWHFDSHPINGSANRIDHINIYSKSSTFRVHITWD